MTGQFDGQVIVVVGGTRGIGAAICTDLASRGAQIVIAGRDLAAGQQLAEQLSADGGLAEALTCDVTVEQDCADLIASVEERYGRLDTMFANQGVAGPSKRITEWSAESVDQSVAVNLVGCLSLAQAAQELLAAGGGGRFIVTGSGSGHTNLPGLGMYGVTKAAVSHLVRQLAIEWRKRSIAVNELIPGPVRTAMTGFDGDGPSATSDGFTKLVESGGEWLKDPEDVAPLARFLAELPTNGPTGKVYSLSARV